MIEAMLGEVGAPTDVIEMCNKNKKNDQKITLCGNIHLGTKKYYDNLSSIFAKSDAVILEGLSTDMNDIDEGLILKDMGISSDYENMINEINEEIKKDPSYINASLEEQKKMLIISQMDAWINHFPKLIKNGLKPYAGECSRKEINKLYKESEEYKKIHSSKEIDMGTQVELVTKFQIPIDLKREQQIYASLKKINTDQSIKSIAITYGQEHIPSILKQLKKMGYEITKQQKLDSVSKIFIKAYTKTVLEQTKRTVMEHIQKS